MSTKYPEPRRLSKAADGPLPLCHDSGSTYPHHAQLASRPPRCSRHFQQFTASQEAARKQAQRGGHATPYAPDMGSPEDQGHLLLDCEDREYVLDLLRDIRGARLALLDEAPGSKAYVEAAISLSTTAKALDQFLMKDLHLDDLNDRSHPPDSTCAGP